MRRKRVSASDETPAAPDGRVAPLTRDRTDGWHLSQLGRTRIMPRIDDEQDRALCDDDPRDEFHN
jgi:hypothetical protein